MLVYCEYSTPRVRYVIHHVFERMLGMSVEWASGAEEFRSANGPRLSYGKERLADVVHVPWSGGVNDLPRTDPQVDVRNDGPALFPVGDEEDLFAGIFYLLSLTDEARCTERDAHGRVPSTSLFTVRKGLADRPWVDQKVMRLGTMLEMRWPGELGRQLQYRNIVTVDMDNILRYAGRPFHRAVGASVKDLFSGAPAALSERWLVRSGSVRDPYAKAIELVEAQRAKYQRAILFFLMRGEGEFDHAADPRHPATQALIQRAARHCEIGIHPSYGTEGNNELHIQERTLLQQIIGRSVQYSRQHFLRWQIPGTLQFLSGSELAEDHTLGFSDRPGFRAGTCSPFPWYDMEREEESKLMLHPFAVMDSALIEQQKLDPDGVFKAMAEMSDAVRAVRGQFISVWHDRYLSGHREFAAWPAVFERVMEHAKA